MTNKIRLPLAHPIALDAEGGSIWAADGEERALVRFDAQSARELGRIKLAEPPTSLAVNQRVIAAGLKSGVVVAFDISSHAEVWQRAVGAAKPRVTATAQHVWAIEENGATLFSFDRSGNAGRISTEGLLHFAAADDQAFWLSREGVLVAQDDAGGNVRTASIPQAAGAGSMAFCANAIWISVSNALLLVEPREFEVKAVLDAPEGPVPFLICRDNKLAGGRHGVFVMDPTRDARLHSLAIEPASPLQALAATSEIIWALESAEPVVHIADFVSQSKSAM